jgi:hypothetical protein
MFWGNTKERCSDAHRHLHGHTQCVRLYSWQASTAQLTSDLSACQSIDVQAARHCLRASIVIAAPPVRIVRAQGPLSSVHTPIAICALSQSLRSLAHPPSRPPAQGCPTACTLPTNTHYATTPWSPSSVPPSTVRSQRRRTRRTTTACQSTASPRRPCLSYPRAASPRQRRSGGRSAARRSLCGPLASDKCKADKPPRARAACTRGR